MIKVIAYGRRRVLCDDCGAMLEYEKNDLKTIQTGMNEFKSQLICPVCGCEMLFRPEAGVGVK